MDLKAYGRKLKKKREALGLSQEQLGEAVGLTRDAISLYERGERGKASLSIHRIFRTFAIYFAGTSSLATVQDVIDWARDVDIGVEEVDGLLPELKDKASELGTSAADQLVASIQTYLAGHGKADQQSDVELRNVFGDETALLQDYRRWQQNAWRDLRGWSSEPISTLYLMPRLGPGHWMDNKAQPSSASCLFPRDLIERYEKMLILGPPGAGKTVLCYHLMTEPLGGDAGASFLPIYVRLPDYAPRVEEREDLIAFAARAGAKRQGCSAEVLEQALRAQAQAGQLLFLLERLLKISAIEQASVLW